MTCDVKIQIRIIFDTAKSLNTHCYLLYSYTQLIPCISIYIYLSRDGGGDRATSRSHDKGRGNHDNGRGNHEANRGKTRNGHGQQLQRPKKNTENFNPSYEAPEMRILFAPPGRSKYTR